MQIGGIIPSSLLDYPGKISAVVFCIGCNFRCPYCQNSWLLDNEKPLFSANDVFELLKDRVGKLDGVVLSGGEPTIQKNIVSFAKRIKEMGFLIKLDTNGNKPEIISRLLDQNLLDYIAMDIKGPLKRYPEIINTNINIENIKESIELIKNSNIKHEFRTTLVRSMLAEPDILECGRLIEGTGTYYLQKFRPDNVLDINFKSEKTYSDKELEIIVDKLSFFVDKCEYR